MTHRRLARVLAVARAFPRASARNLGYSALWGAVLGYLFVVLDDGAPVVTACLVGLLIGSLRYVWRMGTVPSVLPGELRDLVPASHRGLRKVRRGDATAIAATIDEIVATTMGWRAVDVSNVLDAARSPRAALRAGMLVVTTDDADRVAGVAMLSPHVAADTVQLGLWLGPDHRGQGLGRAAIGAAADLAWLLGFDELLLETAETNRAMRRAIEANGGVLRSEGPHPLPNGRTDPGCRYVIPRVPDRS